MLKKNKKHDLNKYLINLEYEKCKELSFDFIFNNEKICTLVTDLFSNANSLSYLNDICLIITSKKHKLKSEYLIKIINDDLKLLNKSVELECTEVEIDELMMGLLRISSFIRQFVNEYKGNKLHPLISALSKAGEGVLSGANMLTRGTVPYSIARTKKIGDKYRIYNQKDQRVIDAINYFNNLIQGADESFNKEIFNFNRVYRQNYISISEKISKINFGYEVLIVRFECVLRYEKSDPESNEDQPLDKGEDEIDRMIKCRDDFIKAIRNEISPKLIFWRLIHTKSGGFRCSFMLVLNKEIRYLNTKSFIKKHWHSYNDEDDKNFQFFTVFPEELEVKESTFNYRFCANKLYLVNSDEFKSALDKAKHYLLGPYSMQGLRADKKIKSFGLGVTNKKTNKNENKNTLESITRSLS